MIDVPDLYRRIAGVTTHYEFTHPVEPADVETVRAALAAVVPDQVVRIASFGSFVRVLVLAGPTRVYARDMLVRGA